MASKPSLDSLCIRHQTGKQRTGDHIPPIHATSTFSFDSVESAVDVFAGNTPGYIYSRWDNPGLVRLEERIAALESFSTTEESQSELYAKSTLFASGMAAISAGIYSELSKGDEILCQQDLYGGTTELFTGDLPKRGMKAHFCDLKDLNEVENLFKSNPRIRLLYIETPANPTMRCYDISALCSIAKRFDCLTFCDNTFASPLGQRPLRLGADLVMHSSTKYLNGHGSGISGVLVGSNLEWMDKIWTYRKLHGAMLSPFEAWILEQGLKTLSIRMKKHSENGLYVAGFLENHPKISKVNYLGLKSHPDFEVAASQMMELGGMMSFELKGGFEAGKEMMNKLEFCVLTASLGTVDTLIQHPASMTHVGVPKNQRIKAGISDGLIRLSVGIEDPKDIISDLESALS